MADKFFFKGRQDARQNHVKHGYNTSSEKKSGTKKYPIEITVTQQARKDELQQQADEANIVVNITLDEREGAVESIDPLTALLNKNGTVRVEKTPARNEPCLCGSGKKYKKCCG